MGDERVHLASVPFLCMSLILMFSVKVTHGSNCVNRLDIAIAVDTTSSLTASNFDEVKTEVKGIVSGLTIGQTKTRLALISMSQSARVVVNFNAVNSLSDFNTAVDSLTFSADTVVELSEGIKVSKDSVLSTARTQKTSKLLILVKDRRSVSGLVSDTAVLSRMASESAAVKALGAVVHAVGIGGLWNKLELEALFSTDYLLFKNKNKALESVKSLNNAICEVSCSNKGMSSQKYGLCYDSTKHIINIRVDLTTNSAGSDVCRKEIDREFQSCAVKQRCNSIDRSISSCGSDGMVTIQNSWQSFDYKVQSCVTTKAVNKVMCTDDMKCSDQVAEVFFILDKSGSIGSNFPKVKQTTRLLIHSMDIGPANVRVGVITFEDNVKMEIQLGAHSNKEDLLRAIDDLSDNIRDGARTYTHLGLKMAREAFGTHGRSEVSRFVVVITDGDSWYPIETFAETALIKSAGATVCAIGVGSIKESELRTMTAPESDTNLMTVTEFGKLLMWSQNFSKRMCLLLSSPSPKLCDDSVFIQSISECTFGRQLITKSEYKYNAARKCIKSIQTTMHQECRAKCIDPIDGNEYLQFDTWTKLCHEFQCKSAKESSFLRTKCPAADGTCRDVGSQPFKCRDENGVEADNCQCINNNGKVTLVIETQ